VTATWLYEAGIGEARAVLVSDGRIVKARIEPDDGAVRLGTVAQAVLAEAGRHPRVTLAGGGAAMLNHLPTGLSIGATLRVEIVREGRHEGDRIKLPRAIPAAPDATPRAGARLLERITASGLPVRVCHPHESDLFEAAGWSEVLDEATSGDIGFPGGILRMALTPAMALFDVDGDGPADALARAAATAVAEAIVRHGIGGSIGVDFPTLAGKAARQAVAMAIDAALPLPFERTAVNGFGFLQIIRPRPRAALPEIIAAAPLAAAARAALRRLEREPPPGPASRPLPGAIARFINQRPDWLADLARRTGNAAPITDIGSDTATGNQ
jgi:hypothetical protein